MSSLQLENRLNVLQYVVIALLVVVIVVPIWITWWISSQLPVVSTVQIDNLQIVGANEFCPGDALVWSYDFHAAGSGNLVRDKTVWSLVPPRTKIFSDREFFILDAPIDQELTEAWHLPLAYRNPETDKMESLPPGRYKRLLSISSPTRSTVIDIKSVEFEIREDCGG